MISCTGIGNLIPFALKSLRLVMEIANVRTLLVLWRLTRRSKSFRVLVLGTIT